MKIMILNCDYDPDPWTNGANILQQHLNEHTILVRNMFQSDFPSRRTLKKMDAAIITGSWAFVHEKRRWLRGFFKTLTELDELRIPTLAICFGFQAVAHLFGGNVRRSTLERGFKTVEHRGHPLFRGLPERFKVFESHFDIVEQVPEGSIMLAKNAHSLQAYQFRDFFCIQFHAEVSPARVKYIAVHDKVNTRRILNGVPMGYKLPAKVLNNFLRIAKKGLYPQKCG